MSVKYYNTGSTKALITKRTYKISRNKYKGGNLHGKKIAILLTLVLTFIAGAAFASASIRLILNGKEIKRDVQPHMVNSRLLLPVRAAAEATRSTVNWDSKTSSVNIITPENIWDDPFPFQDDGSLTDYDFNQAITVLNLFLASYTGGYQIVNLPSSDDYVYFTPGKGLAYPPVHTAGTGSGEYYMAKYEILDSRIIGGSKDNPTFEFAVRMWRHTGYPPMEPQGVYDVSVTSYVVGFATNEAKNNQGYYILGESNIDSKYLKNIVQGKQIKYDPWALSR